MKPINMKHIALLCSTVIALSACAETREVGTVAELVTAVTELTHSYDEIVLTAESYALTATLNPANVKIRGRSDNPRETVVYGDGTFRVISFAKTGGTLANLTVSNGYATAASSSSAAGVLGVSGKTRPLLTNVVVTCCTLADGTKLGYGAAVGSAELRNCIVCGNRATGSDVYGGGVFDCIASDTEIRDNTVLSYGGGAYKSSLYRCTVAGNAAGKSGGGLYDANAYEGTVISNNVAAAAGGGCFGSGAAEWNVLSDSEVCFNRIESSSSSTTCLGAGVAKLATVSHCVIRGNAITDAAAKNRLGAGAYGSVLADCIVRDNFLAEGSAAALYQCTASWTVCSNNCAGASAGGALQETTATDCTFYGAAVEYAGSFFNCKFLNLTTVDAFVFPAGANVVATGSYDGPKCVVSVKKGGQVFAATNCLFAGNHVSTYLFEKSKTDAFEMVNCTIVDNVTKDRTFTGSGIEADAKPVVLINCAFPRNYGEGGNRMDFRTDSTGCNFVLTNCLFGAYKSEGKDYVTPEFGSVNDVADMKFDNSCLAHPYSLSRVSPAIGRGVVMDWMSGATDLMGNARRHDTGVAIGCYECWLPPPGLILLFR